jgi:hypothetical protein
MKQLALSLITVGLLVAAPIAMLPAFAADNTQTVDELRTTKIVGSNRFSWPHPALAVHLARGGRLARTLGSVS